MPFQYNTLTENVTFGSFIDERYKTNRISVNFVVQASEKDVTINALIPRLLKRGYQGVENYKFFYRELENLYGASVSAGVQKRGDLQIISLCATAVDSQFALDGEDMPKLLSQMLCKILFTPLADETGFYKDIVEEEKRALKEAIEGELNEKRYYAINKAAALLCKDEPYALPKYGYLEQVDEITGAMVLEQYHKILSQSKVYVMFTGCGAAQSSIDIFKNKFSAQQQKALAKATNHVHLMSSRISEQTEDLDVNQAKMVLGYGCKNIPEKDELAAIRLMCAILGGTPSSKLFENVREKMSLCYYCASRIDTFKAIMLIDCGIEMQNIEKTKNAIIKQVQELQEGLFTDEQVNIAKLSMFNSYKSLYESDYATEGYYLTKLLLGDVISPEDEMKRLDAVTKDDIIAAARQMELEACYVLSGKDEK